MANALKTKSSWRFGLLILVGVLAANGMAGLAKPKMPNTGVFLSEVERICNLRRDDLAVAGGGYEGGWFGFGNSAYMDFWVTTDSDRLIHVELTRPFNVLDWRLTRFTDGS